MESVLKGKKIVIGVILVLLLVDFLVIAIVSSLYKQIGEIEVATYELVQGLIRLVLGMVLYFFLYKGYKWAKNVILVLFFLGFLFCIFSLIQRFNFLLLIMLIVYGCTISALAFPASAKDFLAYQRGDLKLSSEENENDLSD